MPAITKKQITMRIVGVNCAVMITGIDEVRRLVTERWPGAHAEGSSGGWHWMFNGEIVAATNHALSRFDKHWLAMKDRS